MARDLDAYKTPFANLTGRGVCVAIIDTGIDPTHPSIGPDVRGTGLTIAQDGVVADPLQYRDDFGHGTACAALVHKVAPGCELLAIKMSSGTDAIPPKLLATGIDWAVEQGADIINISAGTNDPDHVAALAESCRKAAEAGVVVVAAEGSSEHPSYPAAFDSVLVVGGETTERQLHVYRSDPRSPRRFMSYGGYQRVAWLDPRFLFLSGTSFAAARISGIIALVVEKLGRMPRERLIEVLRYNSINGSAAAWTTLTGHDLPYAPRRSIDWIRRAMIYPYSKEMHSLVRFRRLLPFVIVAVADPITKGCIGKDAGELIGDQCAGLPITADVEAALQDADTLILGFTSTLAALRKHDIAGDVVRKAINLGKKTLQLRGPRHARPRLSAA